MPRTIKADGRTIVVPDDATDDEINQLVGPAPTPAPPVDTSNVAGAGKYGVPQVAPRAPVNMPPSNLDTVPSNEAEPGIIGGIKAGVHNFGARVANNGINLAKPWAAPVKSMLSHPDFADPSKMGGLYSDIADNSDKGVGFANAAGDAATALLFGKALEGGQKAVAKGSNALANPLKKAGAGVLNSKYPATMKEQARGEDPGRGMLESGIGPTLTKGRLSAKVGAAKEAVGGAIGDAVARADQNASAPSIYSKDLVAPMTGPINEAVARINGPFGTASTEPYEMMRSKLGNTAPGARTPIYGPNAPEVVAPSDLWKTIRNADQNTRFNTDPEVESVNETRRDIRHGLRPILEATDSTIRPMSRTYSDLSAADTAIDRSQSPSQMPKGIAGLVDMTLKSTPLVTTAASGLFKAGNMLNRVGASGGYGVGSAGTPFTQREPAAPFKMLPSETVGNPGGSDFSRGGFPGRPSTVTPAPSQRLTLPSETMPSTVEPMIGVRASKYPSLADDYARTRISPNQFSDISPLNSNGFVASPQGEVLPSRLFLDANEPKGLLSAPPKIKNSRSAKR